MTALARPSVPPAPRLRPWVRPAAGLGIWAVVVGAVTAYLVQGPPETGHRLMVGNATLLVAALYGFVRTLLAARRPGPARFSWLLITVALAFGVLGQLVFASALLRGVPPASSPLSDAVGYLGYSLPLLAALFFFPRPRERLVSTFRGVLDAVVITAGVVLVSERTVLGALTSRVDVTSVMGLATLSYPVVDVALCAVVLTLGMRQPPEWRPTWLCLGAGLLAFAVTDGAYVRLLADGATDLTGSALVVGWVAAPVLLGVATLLPVDASERHHDRNLDLVARLVPYVPVLGAAVLLALGPGEPDPFLVVTGTLLLVSVAVRQVMIVYENLTLTRGLEQKVAERTAQLATLGSIVTSSRDAILGFGLDLRVTAWNPAAEALFGRLAEDVLGGPPDFLPTASRRQLEQTLFDAARGEELSGYETDWVRTDGSSVPIAVSVSPVVDDGVVSGVSFFVQDITERRRAAEALEQARQEALQSARAKSEFLATMSHEIRTPMNGVIGLVALLQDTELDGRQREYVDGVHHAGQALLDVINDILDFSKLEAGKLVLDSERVEVRRLVEEVGDLLSPAAYAKGLELVLDVDPAAVPAVLGDRVRLRQVLLNLASNAVKFTAEGEVRIRVRSHALAAGPDGDARVALQVEVVDTGIGIGEADQSRLFESFAQADASTTRRYGGTGLGLAICRRLVEAMGGAIGVDSAAGAGSTFWIDVPLPVAVATEPRAVPAGRTPPRDRPVDVPRTAGRRGHVLVVEDNELNQLVARGLVERLGFTSDVATNGLEALDALGRQAYDVVLMDCHMPVMDGFATTARIREAERGGSRTPVVALTASALVSDRERCLDSGMDDYLAKPIEAEALAEVLDRWAPPRATGASRTPSADRRSRGHDLAAGHLQPARIDPEQIEGLAELRTPDGVSLLTSFIASFSRRADDRLDVIRDCVDRADDDALAMAAHELKGSAATIGAMRVAALCAVLERGGHAVLGERPDVLDDLAVELGLAVDELGEIADRAA